MEAGRADGPGVGGWRTAREFGTALLPLVALKIDRAFVSRIEERQDKALFRAVVELARRMYLQPVVEGVETEGRARVLRELDCGPAQGFLFAGRCRRRAPGALLQRRSGTALTLLGGAQG